MAEEVRKTMKRTQAVPLATTRNSLTVGDRGRLCLRTFCCLRDGPTSTERVPERVVHAKGSGAYGTLT